MLDGGVLRLTEGIFVVQCSSAAEFQVNRLMTEAFYQAGRLFGNTNESMIRHLAPLLVQHGYQSVQQRERANLIKRSDPQWQSFYEDIRLLGRNIVPFLSKWGLLPDNYEQIYQQMLEDATAPEFYSQGLILTAWGSPP